LEEITKDWSVDLLIPAYPLKIFDINSPETTQDTLGPRRTKKIEEIQDLYSASMNIASISPKKGGDGEELNEKDFEQQQGDKADPLKKRKGFPLKSSFQKKAKATMTKMQTILTSDDFEFLIATLNDDSMEIA